MSLMYELLLKCTKCGLCQQVCPTYQVSKNEMDLARGRVRLARLVAENKYKWQSQIVHSVETCLQCGACVESCPSAVKTDMIMNLAKRDINKVKKPHAISQFIYKKMLTNPKMLKFIGEFTRYYLKIKDKKVLRFFNKLNPIEEVRRLEQGLPAYKEDLPLLPGKAHVTLKIGYFRNCANLAVFNSLAQATLKVVRGSGAQVEYLSNKCCGAPHWFSGDIQTFEELAKYNINNVEFNNYDIIITDCATCGGILKKYGELLDTVEAKAFSDKVMDINEFLIKYGIPDNFSYKTRDDIVTVHDPCHLGRGQKITIEPRKVVSAIPGTILKEMKNSNWCCGGAGVYSVMQPKMSDQILRAKINNILDTSANVVLASCPSCIMQITRGVKLFAPSYHIQVLHPIEYLAQNIMNNNIKRQTS